MYVRNRGAIGMDRAIWTFFPYDTCGGVGFTLVGVRRNRLLPHPTQQASSVSVLAKATVSSPLPHSPGGMHGRALRHTARCVALHAPDRRLVAGECPHRSRRPPVPRVDHRPRVRTAPALAR